MPLTMISVWLGVSIAMPFGHRVLDRMREAEREVQLLALHGGAITDADELELASRSPSVTPVHHVRDQRARRARDRALRERAARARLDLHGRAVDFDLDLGSSRSARGHPSRP